MISWERAPPSDQEANAATVLPEPVVGAAVTVTREPWMKVSEYGVAWSVPLTVTVAPLGALANDRATVFGLSCTVRESVSPPLSVTVTVSRRCEGYSWSGAWKLPDETPGKVVRLCVWHTSPGQCRMARFHENAEAGMVPCWGSVARRREVDRLPDRPGERGAGVTVPSTGAELPAWICWVAVDVWPWPSSTRRLDVVGARGVAASSAWPRASRSCRCRRGPRRR